MFAWWFMYHGNCSNSDIGVVHGGLSSVAWSDVDGTRRSSDIGLRLAALGVDDRVDGGETRSEARGDGLRSGYLVSEGSRPPSKLRISELSEEDARFVRSAKGELGDEDSFDCRNVFWAESFL